MVVMFNSILPDSLMLRSWWLCLDPYFQTLLLMRICLSLMPMFKLMFNFQQVLKKVLTDYESANSRLK